MGNSNISFLNFGDLLLRIKPFKILSRFIKVLELGVGRDNRTCVNVDIIRLLTITTFPKGVKNLVFHMVISFNISLIIFSILMSEFLSILLMSYEMPKHSNFWVHSRFKSGQNKVLLSPHFPILITLVFSLLTFSPDID